MRVLEHRARVTLPDGTPLDLQVRGLVDPQGDMDPVALRDVVLAALRDHLHSMGADAWHRTTQLHGAPGDEPDAAEVEGPFHLKERPSRPPRPRRLPDPPVDLPEPQRRQCHRLLSEVWRLGVGGRAVSFKHLVDSGAYATQTLTRVLDPASPTYAYLRPYLRVQRSGRHRLLDLTQEGRFLVSRLRAGVQHA